MRVSDTALVYAEGRRHYNLRNNRFACMVGMPQLPYIATANSTPHRLSVDNNKEVDPAEQERHEDGRCPGQVPCSTPQGACLVFSLTLLLQFDEQF